MKVDYHTKYLKYKRKYLDLKEQILLSGGYRQSYLDKALFDTKNHCEPGENFDLTSPKKYGNKYRLAFLKSRTSANFFEGTKAVTKKEGYKAGSPVTIITPSPPPGNSIWDIKNPPYIYIFAFPLGELKNILLETKGKNSKLTTYLGLLDEWSSKDSPYNNLFIVEVDASNVKRPCKNNSPELKKCPCTDSQKDKEYSSLLSEEEEMWRKWFDNFFKNSIEKNIPFTGMGYTYKWGNTRKKKGENFVPSLEVVGASEYIIKPGSKIKVLKRVEFDENLTPSDIANNIKI